MKYSPEALGAFLEAAALGSFSAAARKLGKTQSTISTAIANLEVDLGIILFDRTTRYPTLTEAGSKVLSYVKEIQAASQRLEELTIRLAENIEPRLTMVLSDTYQLNPDHKLMHEFSTRYPDVELECLDAEGGDVIDLVQSGRAHFGLLVSLPTYPSDISARRLNEKAEMSLYAGRKHPLAQIDEITTSDLAKERQIYLNTYIGNKNRPKGRAWSASDYLMVLEMAEEGFGWAELPKSLVKQYGRGRLKELKVDGWPKRIFTDVVWSKNTAPGAAGFWFLDQLIAYSSKEKRAG